MLILLGEDKPFNDLDIPLVKLPTRTFLKFTWIRQRGKDHAWQAIIDAQMAVRQAQLDKLEMKMRATIRPELLLLLALMSKK